ncbi:MAG TPA: hypothetical protein VNW97_15330 [Candidatus Saccharimonadales bacterium]|nr:hypothetical protein [Candidatus Saccharimonadales bacterium]
MTRRILISFATAALAFILIFVVFNIAYGEWAMWRYPHHNSMAGFAAFIYGFPVGAVCAGLVFIATFYYYSVTKSQNT